MARENTLPSEITMPTKDPIEEPTVETFRKQIHGTFDPREISRRTVLRTLGASVAGGVALTGSTVAAQTDQDGTIRLVAFEGGFFEGGGHDFSPDSYQTDPGSVTWLHDDSTLGGIVHNVRIHEHGNRTNQLNSPRLSEGDTYVVDFSLEDGGSILRLSDDRRSITIDVSGKSKQELGVHCDYHVGQTDLEGSMKMENFVVNLS